MEHQRGARPNMHGQHIHRWAADELGHKQIGWPAVELHRSAQLLQTSLVEHGDPVAHGHRFYLVMGDINSGGPKLPLEVNDPRARASAQFCVEIAQRFIHEEDLWFSGHGPAQGHPLFLSARQFFRASIEELIQFERLRHILDALLELLLSMRGNP